MSGSANPSLFMELAEMQASLREDETWGWDIVNSSIDDYGELLHLPSGGVRRLIERTIGKSEENVGIDLAGGFDGQAIRDLVQGGYIGRGAYNSFFDSRTESAATGVDFIEGDLTQESTWQAINDWKIVNAPRGLSVALHRPLDALQELPSHTYVGLTELVINMLKPGGIFYSQIPRAIRYRPDNEYGRHLYEQVLAIDGVHEIKLFKQRGMEDQSGLRRYGACLIQKAQEEINPAVLKLVEK